MAFALHYTFALPPNAIWCAMVRTGHAIMLSANLSAEKLRNTFVKHKGKKELVMREHDFQKGFPDNAWPGVFGKVSSQLLTPDLSTTGPMETQLPK